MSETKALVSDRMRDISLGGAYVYLDEKLPEGTRCTVNIELFGQASLLSIEVEAQVARVDSKGMGLEFTKIDLDSLVHLRHLIRIHSIDSGLMDEEYEKQLLDL